MKKILIATLAILITSPAYLPETAFGASRKELQGQARAGMLFVECKRRLGQLKQSHIDELNQLLQAKGLTQQAKQILNSHETKSWINKMIETGTCQEFRQANSIKEAADYFSSFLNRAEVTYFRFDNWQKQLANVFATAECKIRKGELKPKNREKFISKNYEKITWPPKLPQSEVDEFFSDKNLAAIGWLTVQKTSRGICRYEP